MESRKASSRNSFLEEIDRNEEITSEIRRKIDKRYNNSETNQSYKFPRISSELIEPKKKKYEILKRENKKYLKSDLLKLSSIYLNKQNGIRLPELIKKTEVKVCSKMSIESSCNNSLSGLSITKIKLNESRSSLFRPSRLVRSTLKKVIKK